MGRNSKEYLMNFNNQLYFASFMEYFEANSTNKNSVYTYKKTLGNFLEYLNDMDLAQISPKDITDYTSNNNQIAHIRAMLKYIAKNNSNGALRKMSKELLVWLI
ncbi:hypothetical protein [Anaerovorax sp. IOR16]|uniref:hypothetical protein n=1 Tax=Anaerovorax sp. IOR16 TaxID=2773458 RepID=UPI0019D14FAD|nr:hypothetical protein [Anaerovorax sp. IOR16]